MGPGHLGPRGAVSRPSAWFLELPAVVRWGIVGTVGALVVVTLGVATWSWLDHREARAQRAVGRVEQQATQALARGERSALDAGAVQLRAFLKDHGGSRASSKAWYLLGGVEFQRGDLGAAATAYGEAARRGSPSVAALSRLDLSYVREAKGDLPGALQAVNQGLQGRTARDFLYQDLLMAKGRFLEETKDMAGAVDVYRRLLRELPAAARGDEVRGRLALLGASP